MEYDLEAFSSAISTYFNCSPQRWDKYSELCSPNLPSKFPTFVAVRWLSLGNLVVIIEKAWPTLVTYFSQVTDAPKTIRIVFNSRENTEEFLCLIKFGAFIMDKFNKMNANTQVLSLNKIYTNNNRLSSLLRFLLLN